MLKIKPRSHYKELTAVFALMLGISGGATIALNNQPGYRPVSGPGNVAGVSTSSRAQSSTSKQTTAQAQVDKMLDARAQSDDSRATVPPPASHSAPWASYNVVAEEPAAPATDSVSGVIAPATESTPAVDAPGNPTPTPPDPAETTTPPVPDTSGGIVEQVIDAVL